MSGNENNSNEIIAVYIFHRQITYCLNSSLNNSKLLFFFSWALFFLAAASFFDAAAAAAAAVDGDGDGDGCTFGTSFGFSMDFSSCFACGLYSLPFSRLSSSVLVDIHSLFEKIHNLFKQVGWKRENWKCEIRK